MTFKERLRGRYHSFTVAVALAAFTTASVGGMGRVEAQSPEPDLVVVIESLAVRAQFIDAIVNALEHPAGGALAVSVSTDIRGRTVIGYEKGGIDRELKICGPQIAAVECLDDAPLRLLLVVTAADGPTAVAREHALAAAQIGATSAMVFLDTSNVDDPELIALIETEIIDMLLDAELPLASPIVRGTLSAVETGRLEELLDVVLSLLNALNAPLN